MAVKNWRRASRMSTCAAIEAGRALRAYRGNLRATSEQRADRRVGYAYDLGAELANIELAFSPPSTDRRLGRTQLHGGILEGPQRFTGVIVGLRVLLGWCDRS